MTSGTIDIRFADGLYDFALPLPQIDELQKKTGIGIGGLFARVLKGVIETEAGTYVMPANGEFHVADIVDTIRLGLIGGGRGVVNGSEVVVTPVLALKLVEQYVYPPANPLKDNWSLATSILATTIVGYDPPKKDLPADGAGSPPKKRAGKKKVGSTTA